MYWRDIPSRVIARSRRETAAAKLSDRFQRAIRRAAMRAGKGSSDPYLSEWRREAASCGKDLQAAVAEAVERLEQRYSDEMLERMVKANGLGCTSFPAPPTSPGTEQTCM